MKFSFYELCFFFFAYSFLGWALEVCYRALRTGQFVNRGLLSGPLCPAYGAGMCLVTVALTDLGTNIPAQLVGCVVIANLMQFAAGDITERLSGRRLSEYKRQHQTLGSLAGLLYTALWGGLATLALYFLNPFVYLLCQLLPALLLRILVWVLLALLACDTLTMLFVLRLTRRESVLAADVSQRLHTTTATLGQRIYASLRRHLVRAYPELAEQNTRGKGFGKPNARVFAPGLCLEKLVWVFTLCALLGDWIETVYVFAVSGVLMSRSSLLYGTFSVVWGAGAALLTAMLTPLAEKNDRYVFLGGFFLGGAYEYLCSVFTELVFGTVFWDYSNMPLNIGGRTNVLFMIFWGLLSVVWVKILYPKLSAVIEKIPPIAGTIATWVLVVLLCADMLLSGAAMLRYLARQDGTAHQSAYGTFMDTQYPDNLVEWTWPNMRRTS